MLFSLKLNKFHQKKSSSVTASQINSSQITRNQYNIKYSLLKVPNTPINVGSLNFRILASRLEIFKSNISNESLTKLFLSDPYSTTLDVNTVDKLWTRIANAYVNDISDVPSGYGKRLTFCTNDGYVFIDVSTFQPDGTKHLNYSMITMNQSYYVKSSGDYQIINDDPIFNPENTNIDSMTNGTALEELCNIKCGSTTEPIVDKTNLNDEATNAVTYQKMDIESTRKEYLMTHYQKYGWASRYSNSLYSPSYYVATQMTGKYGYSIYIRFSIYLL
jgi:hypothetical protein